MENTKILTIGIPVYNEERSLGKNLSNIINIIRQNNLSEHVDVFVSNNSSTDGTETICDNYLKCNSVIFHCCTNKTNIGFDKNVDQLIYMSKGEYVWLVSGNDTITEQGLLEVLKMINNNHPNLIVLDRGGMNSESKFYDSWVNFLNDMKGLNILISVNIIKKDLWISYNLKKYIGSGWIFMGYTISCFNNYSLEYDGGGGIIFKKAIIEDLFEEGVKWDDGKGNWLAIGLKLTDMFYYNLNNVYLRNNCCRMMIGGELRYSELITIARYQGLIISAEIIRQIKRAMCYSKFAYYFYMFPSIYLPLPLIATLGKFKSILCKYKVLRKIMDYLNHINSRINRIIVNKGNK